MIVCWFVTMDTRRVASRSTVAGASGTRDRPARAGTSCSKVIVAIPPFYIPCFWQKCQNNVLHLIHPIKMRASWAVGTCHTCDWRLSHLFPAPRM